MKSSMKAGQKARSRDHKGASSSLNLDALRRQYSFRPRRSDDDQDGQAL